MVSMLQTTSPQYLTLASLDLARRQAVTQGEKMLGRVIRLAEDARRRINMLKHITCIYRKDIR
jgi:lysine decarboxylase